LLPSPEKGNNRAHLPLDAYFDRFKKYSGTYIAILKGVDAPADTDRRPEKVELVEMF
jgi:acetate kinase